MRLPNPPEEDLHDFMRPARGIIHGCILGVIAWLIIGLGIYAYYHQSKSDAQEFPPREQFSKAYITVKAIGEHTCFQCHERP